MRFNLRRVIVTEPESWIYIPNTNNKYICSSYGRVSVYDKQREQFRLLSGVYSITQLHYYWILNAQNMRIRFYEGQALELFSRPHDEPMYFDSNLKVKQTQIIQKFLNGEDTKDLCESYDMTYKQMSDLISSQIGRNNYRDIIKQRRRDRLDAYRPHKRSSKKFELPEEDIIRDYQSGLYYKDIAEKYHTSFIRIKAILENNLSYDEYEALKKSHNIRNAKHEKGVIKS